MALKVPTVGEVALLKNMLGVTSPGPLTIKLYVNDKVPEDGDVAADFTEMSTHGYGAKTLAPGGWTVVDDAGAAVATAAEQVWSFTAASAVTVYGYYVVDGSGALCWAERLSSNFIVEFAGDTAKITPKFSLASL